MGFVPVKAFMLSMLLMSCMTVFGEEVEIVTEAQPPIPPHHHPRYPGPVAAPTYPPRPSHHHRHHPPVHPPSHAPAHPPSHHHKSHPPSYPPVHPPSQAPTHPPSHHHKSHPPVQSPTHPPSHPPINPPHPYFPKRSLVAVQGVVYCKSCKYIGVDTLLGASPLLGAVVRLQCNNTKYPLVQEAKTDKNGYFFIQAAKKITTYGAHKCKVSLVSSPLKTCNKATDLHSGLKGAILKLDKPPVDSPPPPFALFSVGPFAFEPASAIKCPR